MVELYANSAVIRIWSDALVELQELSKFIWKQSPKRVDLKFANGLILGHGMIKRSIYIVINTYIYYIMYCKQFSIVKNIINHLIIKFNYCSNISSNKAITSSVKPDQTPDSNILIDQVKERHLKVFWTNKILRLI